jgi:Fic/DOC family
MRSNEEVMKELICPSFENMPGTLANDCAFQIKALSTSFPPNDARAIGIEQKICWQLLQESDEWPAELSRIFYRLSQEALIMSHWAELTSRGFGDLDLQNFVSLLAGRKTEFREKDMLSLTLSADDATRYEPIRISKSWRADVLNVDASDCDPVVKALYRFARIIFAHPFRDANGRFARASLQGALGAGGLLFSPCLGLAPTFFRQGAVIRQSLWDLSATGNWEPYFESMSKVLNDAVCSVRLAVTATKPQ